MSEIDDHRLAARVRAAADAERRAIERNLHDGVQQDLVALCVNLELASQLADSDLGAAKTLLDEIRRDVRETLDGVRALAYGVYPSLLPVRGLADALRTIPASLEAAELGRYPLEVEQTVYFCCLDLVRHSSPNTTLRVWQAEGNLCFAVTGEIAEGAALADLRDRLAAFGGELTVSINETCGTVPI